MSKEHDRQFFDTFMIVLGALVAFTIIIYFIANAIHARTQAQYVAEDRLRAMKVAERIEPVGDVAIAGQAAPAPVAAPAPAAPPPAAAPAPVTQTAALDGAKVYNGGCMACHTAGVGGAPKTGDVEAWAPRIAQGMEVLYDHAINGFDGEALAPMLPKGGLMHLSDAEVRAAVDYMVAESQ